MKVKYRFLAFSVVFLVFAITSTCTALSTREIDAVRDKGVLNKQDLQVIDSFLAEAVTELMRTTDFTSIARLHTTLMSRSASAQESAQPQYANQFSESAYKYISRALTQSKTLTPEDLRFKIVVNLMIIVDNIKDVKLAGLAVDFLDDNNEVVRYWAVRSVTSSTVTKKLNVPSTENLKQAKEIVSGLEKLVGKTSPEITELMARFAADINISQAQQLLIQIADDRIKKYAEWAVRNELLDATILQLLCDKVSSSQDADRTEIAARFIQLYSYAIQRYLKGRDYLTPQKNHDLVSVLVEAERACISELMEMPQSTIKTAIERGDYNAILAEHDRLLGSKEKAGQLPLKIGLEEEKAGPKILSEKPGVTG